VRAALRDAVFLSALTAYGSPADRQRAYEAGFDVHRTKPADPHEICRLVAREALRAVAVRNERMSLPLGSGGGLATAGGR
jgi:CheY-like chemotaxis protein